MEFVGAGNRLACRVRSATPFKLTTLLVFALLTVLAAIRFRDNAIRKA